MSKTNIDLGDFTIASRISTTRGDPDKLDDISAEAEADDRQSIAQLAEGASNESTMLQKRSLAEREEHARQNAVAREEARHSLRSLKRAKQREVKFFVNVALDRATKTRLKRAADENDLKMAVVMKAAIDFYLRENGY